MNIHIPKISGSRTFGGKALGDLSLTQAIAVAMVASVGVKASATAAEGQAWGLAAGQAVQICKDIMPDPDEPNDWTEEREGDKLIRVAARIVWNRRLEALAKQRDAVIGELRDAALTQSVAETGLARDVRKVGELDSVQSLMSKAEKRTVSYYDGRIGRGFKAGIAPAMVNIKGQGDVPESAGTYQKKVIAKESTLRAATGQSDLRARLGIFRGNLSELAPDKLSLDTSGAIAVLLNGVESIIKAALLGVVSHDDVANAGESLQHDAETAVAEWKEANKDAGAAILEDVESLLRTDETDDEAIHEAPERGGPPERTRTQPLRPGKSAVV